MRRSALIAGLAALLHADVAHAEPRDEARRAFNEGLLLIEAGDYDAGIAKFEEAYDLVPHPAVLYNIGRAYADAGDYQQAIVYFERYLLTEPIDRAEVEGFIGVMEGRLADQQAASAPAPTPATPAPVAAGGSATAAEIAELRRHAEELAALAEVLAEREASGTPATPDPVVVEPIESGDAALPVPTGDGLDGALVEDLFDREVVTASNFGQDPVVSPSAITVITAEDIRMSGATSIPELLQQVPGMDVMALTAGQSDVSIRGFNRRLSNKVLVLVDGRSVYLDFIGAVVWETLPVTLEEIERIEVIRGPGSAIYGANAFGGVVNIITKAPGDPAVDSVVRLGAGTVGYGEGSGVVSGREGNLGYRVSARYAQKGRWAQEIDLEQRPDVSSDVADQNLAVDVLSGNGQLDWRLGERGYASLSGGLSEGLVEFYSLGALRNFYLDSRQVYARGDAGFGPFHARVFYMGLTGNAGSWYYPTGGVNLTSQLDSDVLDTTLEGYWELGAEGQHQLAVGASYRYKSIRWDFLGQDAVQHHFGGYIQDQSDLGPILINAAVRVDRHPLLQTPPVSPRLAVIARLGEGRSVRVNGGTAFRTPTFIESYSDLLLGTDTDGVFVNSTGDPRLLPERIAAVEFGYVDQSSDLWSTEVAGYGYQIDNLIDLGPVDASTRPFEGFDEEVGAYVAGTTNFANQPTVFRAVGAEAAGEFYGLPGLDLSASYSVERIVEQSASGPLVVTATPRHRATGGLAWRSPWQLDLGFNASWVSAQVWPIRGFDDAGNIVTVDAAVEDRLILANTLAWRPHPSLELRANAWNWGADVVGASPQHPLGQPVGARYSGSVAVRF